MTCERSENLPVWQSAADLYEPIEELLENGSLQATHSFPDRLDRDALSVSNNIAEGFDRGTAAELISFLYIARGAAGAVRSLPLLAERRAVRANWPGHLKSQVSRLKSLAEFCSRQLRGWTGSLQNTKIEGQRRLTEASSREDEQERRAAAFQNELLDKLPPGHRLHKEAEDRGLI